MSEERDPELVNPYHHAMRPGSRDRLGWRIVLRRTVLQIVVLVIGLALIMGTVVQSCGTPV